MGYPDQVSADLARYEKEQYELDRNFDPADLSEVDLDEFDEFLGDIPVSARVKMVQAIRIEDWDQFGIEVRAALIESRKEI